jgi:hypothetical protein
MSDKSVLSVHPAYRSAIKKILGDIGHEGQLEPKNDIAVYQFEVEGCILSCSIDANHTIRDARFANGSNEVQKALLEGLCRIIIGMPIQECNDHSIIRLEHELRDRTVPAPVIGVTMPQNAGEAFKLCVSLCRGLYQDYLKITGHSFGRNSYIPPFSEEWSQLESDDKEARIVDYMKSELPRYGIELGMMELVGLLEGRRVILKVSDAIADVNVILMQFETGLRIELDNSLEVFLQNESDANKLRMGKLDEQNDSEISN